MVATMAASRSKFCRRDDRRHVFFLGCGSWRLGVRKLGQGRRESPITSLKHALAWSDESCQDRPWRCNLGKKPRRAPRDVPGSLPKRDDGTDVVPDDVRPTEPSREES